MYIHIKCTGVRRYISHGHVIVMLIKVNIAEQIICYKIILSSVSVADFVLFVLILV